MKIGPFNVRELEPIQDLLKSKNIAFEAFIDKDLEAELLKKFNELATYNPRTFGGTLDLRTVFFEITEQDFEIVKNDLEKYGITKPSDGSYELGEDS